MADTLRLEIFLMARYHYNPLTGEPGACRAKAGNCPFLAEGALHFSTKEQARKAYEEFQEKGFQCLTAQLMVMRARLQRDIIAIFSKKIDGGLSEAEDELLKSMASERNAIEKAINSSSKEHHSNAPTAVKRAQKILYEIIADDRGDSIIGIPNREEELTEKAPQTAQALVDISEQWLSRLSTEEAKAVWDYAGNPETANARGEILSHAIEKSPLMEPTKVYSGLSLHVARDVMTQVGSGKITLSYPISTSVNPAQINGFMTETYMDETDGSKNIARIEPVAIEIETTVGGSMASASHALYEFEILLPAGTYEVVDRKEHVKFLWEEGGPGKEAAHFIRLRRID